MPYRMMKKGYPWQGGQDRFVKEFFPLSPYQISSGLRESGQLSSVEVERFHRLEDEEDLAQAASQGVEDRKEERGEITAEELRQYRKEVWERGGYLDPNVIQ